MLCRYAVCGLVLSLLFCCGCDKDAGQPPAEPGPQEVVEARETPPSADVPSEWSVEAVEVDSLADASDIAALANASPGDHLFFIASAGHPSADAESAYAVEQLLADPAVEPFVELITSAFDRGFADVLEQGSDLNASGAAKGAVILREVLDRPMAAYLSEVKVTKVNEYRRTAALSRGGLVIDLGESAGNVGKLLPFLLEAMPSLPGYSASQTDDGMELTGEDVPTISIRIENGRLLAAMGDGELDALRDRLARTDTPSFFQQAVENSGVECPLLVVDVDIAKVVASEEMAAYYVSPREQQREEFLVFTHYFGVRTAERFSAVIGLDATGMASRAVLSLGDPQMGLLSPKCLKPIAPSDMALVPRDAAVAAVVKFDASSPMDLFFESIRATMPGDQAAALEAEMREQMPREFEEEFGCDLQSDILPKLGDAWCAYATKLESGMQMSPPGWVVYNRVKDASGLEEAFTAAVQARFFDRIARYEFRADMIGPVDIDGATFAFQLVGASGPIQPTLALVGDYLVLADSEDSLQAFQEHLASPGGSLANVPEVRQAMARGPASVFVYEDSKSTTEMFYEVLPGLAMMAGMAGVELPPEVMAILEKLPPKQTMVDHMTPTTLTLGRTQRGIEFSSHYPLPLATPTVATAIAPALMAQQQRQAANNMKRLLLAFHNYHDTYKQFPPAWNVLGDRITRTEQPVSASEEKPLLSWRVHLLPYLGERDLYEQFHLDEPWDSPHNVALIARMPDVFRRPRAKCPAGMTSYQLVDMEKAAILDRSAGNPDDPDGLFSRFSPGMRNITDGTSNTVLLVETNDESAVIWTKPDDYVPGDVDPLGGLIGNHRGSVMFGLCDGSVHAIRDDIPVDVFKALVTRNGGEVVRPGDYRGSSAGAKPMPESPGSVRGIIKVNGEPADIAYGLTFISVDGGGAYTASASADGAYSVRSLPPGDYRIATRSSTYRPVPPPVDITRLTPDERLMRREMYRSSERRIPQRYTQRDDTPLRVTVQSGENTIDIDIEADADEGSREPEALSPSPRDAGGASVSGIVTLDGEPYGPVHLYCPNNGSKALAFRRNLQVLRLFVIMPEWRTTGLAHIPGMT